jgi:adenosylhomocysteinase
LEDSKTSQAQQYFACLTSRYKRVKGLSSVCVTHLLPNTPPFLDAVDKIAELACVLAKPKSVDDRVEKDLRQKFRCEQQTREFLADPDQAVAFLEARIAERHVVLLDVGGYFAPALNDLCARFSGTIVGVVEDTENGLQKYEDLGTLPCPVYCVARSPLKNAEDHLVGVSIVFSTEAILRSYGDTLEGRSACVIGYGKIGRSVAAQLQSRNVNTTIYDRDPIRTTEAMAHGFQVARDVAGAVTDAGLVVCATGNRALGADDVGALATGAYVASVTSSDDELGLEDIRRAYRSGWVGDDIEQFIRADHHFLVLNEGNAVNFVHGATLGPSIYLVQGEILAAIHELAQGESRAGIARVSDEERYAIAEAWLKHFCE